MTEATHKTQTQQKLDTKHKNDRGSKQNTKMTDERNKNTKMTEVRNKTQT